MIKCFRCGTSSNSNLNYCKNCGQHLKRWCDNCHDCGDATIPIDAKFCPRCGGPMFVKGDYRGFHIILNKRCTNYVTEKDGNGIGAFTLSEMKAAIDIVLEYGWSIKESDEWSDLIQTRRKMHE